MVASNTDTGRTTNSIAATSAIIFHESWDKVARSSSAVSTMNKAETIRITSASLNRFSSERPGKFRLPSVTPNSVAATRPACGVTRFATA